MTIYQPMPRRSPAEKPVAIRTKWFMSGRTRPFDDFKDYYYEVVWADGTVETRDSIPNEWIPIEEETADRMAQHHAEGRSTTARHDVSKVDRSKEKA